ncbi:MAG TPA: hypothetical protein DCL61_13540 [Cyanobacteria bacterium UBA12227]|nr:hypothetical protein [Cyanobacteria bacterium UBA12227]HAX86946.1 hypothetical protein [Cyanobacteria bacterium UBA11370]HBY78403.1 hypothetical protein [Cyanobacteria bacterium UBA11148]
MTVQDDRRENELIKLFALKRPPNPTRSGTDAILDVNGYSIPFELKSTTSSSVTTVRDFGLDHIKKWQGKHWLFGFYNKQGTELLYCLYASPTVMSQWISEKEIYIMSDYKLGEIAPERLTLDDLYAILGQKDSYTLPDARSLQKKQYTTQQYYTKMDLPQGYSPERMLSILKERCRYLIQRGSTLNNPHILASYFQGWERITENHAQRLRELVIEALQDKA